MYLSVTMQISLVKFYMKEVQMIFKKTPRILYEDSDILVCHKPAGIATQTKKLREPDLVSLLKRHLYINAKNNGVASSGEPYLSVIHRLDQPVCGLLVFAKSPRAAAQLSKQLQAHDFSKTYRAILCRKPDPPTQHLIHYLQKDSSANRSFVCTKNDARSKKAALTYRVLESAKPKDYQIFTEHPTTDLMTHPLVEIELETGRHHQIRVQMSTIGCPIIGDDKYGATILSLDCGINGIALCAYKLEFQHPLTREHLSYQL